MNTVDVPAVVHVDDVAAGRDDAAVGVKRDAADAPPLRDDGLDLVSVEPVDPAAEDVAEQHAATRIDGRTFDEAVTGREHFELHHRVGGYARRARYRFLDASVQGRTRATQRRARCSAKGERRIPPTTPPRSEQDPGGVVGCVRVAARGRRAST